MAGNPFTRQEYRQAYESLRVGTLDEGSTMGSMGDLNVSSEVRAKYTYFMDWENRMGTTPLILASVQGDLALVDELIKRDSILDHENRLGHTALTWGVICGHDEVKTNKHWNSQLGSHVTHHIGPS